MDREYFDMADLYTRELWLNLTGIYHLPEIVAFGGGALFMDYLQTHPDAMKVFLSKAGDIPQGIGAMLEGIGKIIDAVVPL